MKEDFAKIIRSLFLDANSVEVSKSALDTSLNTSKSERQKKPSTRWIEEVGYLATPPKLSQEEGYQQSPLRRYAYFSFTNFRLVKLSIRQILSSMWY